MKTVKLAAVAVVSLLSVVGCHSAQQQQAQSPEDSTLKSLENIQMVDFEHDFAEDPASVNDYWTPDKLKNAKPVPLVPPGAGPGQVPNTSTAPGGGDRDSVQPTQSPPGTTESGQTRPGSPSTNAQVPSPTTGPAAKPSGESAEASATGIPTTEKPQPPLKIVQPSAGGSRTPKLPAANERGSQYQFGGLATKATGKVFFQANDDQDYVCSASVVDSPKGNVVATAGHCVYSEPGESSRGWVKNWIFVPGYSNGSEPYGRWTARKALATPAWISSSSSIEEYFAHDVGFVVLDGQPVQQTTGAFGLVFGLSEPQQALALTALGYPAGPPFDGETLRYCSSRHSTFDPKYPQSESVTIDCIMTGGCSGGPWLNDFDSATGSGYVMGVNSHHYGDRDTIMVSPRFAAPELEIYTRASKV